MAAIALQFPAVAAAVVIAIVAALQEPEKHLRMFLKQSNIQTLHSSFQSDRLEKSLTHIHYTKDVKRVMGVGYMHSGGNIE